MCFLVAAYENVLIDVDRTNYFVVVDEISKQIKNGEIKHPFVFGRTLYDRAASLFEDQRNYLSVQDTAKLLADSPEGVWQAGELVTGPFGVIRAKTRRSLYPYTDVPLQHCADLSCRHIHRVQLSTDSEAPINLHRWKLTRHLEHNGREPSDWNGFIDDLVRETQSNAVDPDDLHPGSISYLLGDALTDDELRCLFRSIIDNGGTELRQITEMYRKSGPSEKLAASLSRAEVLQLLLTVEDSLIIQQLDECIRKNLIEVPEGEIRTARVNSTIEFGRWGLQAELSRFGVSIRGRSVSLPMLRLRRLISGMYNSNDLQDMQTLDWQLRSVDADTPAAKLAEYVRTESVRSIVSNLVLVRRENAEHACSALRLPAPTHFDDDSLVSAIMWKLGFDLSLSTAPHARFFSHQEGIATLVEEARLSSTVNEDAIQKEASVYFTALEEVLNDSLMYVTWALTTDHYVSSRPFVYRRGTDAKDAAALLSSITTTSGESVDLGDANTLYPLIRGFAVLASHLDSLRDEPDSYLREPSMYPKYVEPSGLHEFPFRHTVPFLDVHGAAQIAIVEQLHEIARSLSESNVAGTRNDLLHFRRTTVDIRKVHDCLEAVRKSVKILESLGALRIPYLHASTRSDEWGRRTVTLMNSDRQPVSFTRPSPYDRVQMPNLMSEQYLMHSTLFAEPNEVFRFAVSHESPYEQMWESYPNRRKAKDNSVAKQSESAVGEVDAIGRSRTRTG